MCRKLVAAVILSKLLIHTVLNEKYWNLSGDIIAFKSSLLPFFFLTQSTQGERLCRDLKAGKAYWGVFNKQLSFSRKGLGNRRAEGG